MSDEQYRAEALQVFPFVFGRVADFIIALQFIHSAATDAFQRRFLEKEEALGDALLYGKKEFQKKDKKAGETNIPEKIKVAYRRRRC